MYNLSRRLKIIMKIKGYTISELSTSSGISEDTIKSIRSNKIQNPGVFTVSALANVLNCSLDDLLGRTSSNGDETDLLRKWRALSPHGKKTSMISIDSELEKQPVNWSDTRNILCYIPTQYVDNGAVFDENSFEYITIPTDYMKSAQIAIKVISSSLVPTYFPGDILAIEKRPPQNEEAAIYIKDGYEYIRRYVKVLNTQRYIPLHPQNREAELTNIDEYNCLGTITGIIRI